MRRKRIRAWPNTGLRFWGCPDYPECKGTASIDPTTPPWVWSPLGKPFHFLTPGTLQTALTLHGRIRLARAAAGPDAGWGEKRALVAFLASLPPREFSELEAVYQFAVDRSLSFEEWAAEGHATRGQHDYRRLAEKPLETFLPRGLRHLGHICEHAAPPLGVAPPPNPGTVRALTVPRPSQPHPS